MKRTLLLLLLPLLLTSCSNPDTTGGVTLSRGADDGNEFPHGSCEGSGKNPPGGGTGCGWVHTNNGQYFIQAGANMFGAPLKWANLNGAALNGTGLTGANFYAVKADRWTICPDGHTRGSGGDCPF